MTGKLTPEDVAKAEAILAGKAFNVRKVYCDPATMDFNELCYTIGNTSAIASAEKAMKRKGFTSHPYLTHIEACKKRLQTLLKR